LQATEVDEAGQSRIKLVKEVCDYLKENPSSKMTLDTLGKRFSTSPFLLQRVFVDVMGMSPRRYLEECRLAILKERLAKGEAVIPALHATGYSSQSWLYEDSRTRLGMTPATYRRGGEGTTVVYATGASPLGRMLVGATKDGVCSIHVGENDEELVKVLRKEYPKARVVRGATAAKYLHDVNRHLGGQRCKLPLDIRGTDFQLRVWTALRFIPLGETRSYSDVAKMIGEPRAVRAVANACASNPVPLIVPCHRVIRKDGNLGGYGLGLPRKKMLLTNERKLASTERAG
jgi:AraC family transcriptional regulator, regulatory protein of adaptative response / methylated-DNA-[protein]-cysteine methyltransferase